MGCIVNQYRDLLDAYAGEVDYADCAFEIFFMMKYGDKKWEKAYKIAPAFFSIARKSIFQEAFLTLGKLFKTTGGSERNLIKLLNLIESEIKIFDDNGQKELKLKIGFYRDEIEARAVSVNKITRWRDKLLAHYDKEYFTNPNKIVDDSGLSLEEIRDLIDVARTMINDISLIILNERVSIRPYNFEDINDLMYKLLRIPEPEDMN